MSNKPTIIIIILLIVACLGSWFWYKNYLINQQIGKQAELSQQFGQGFKTDLEKQPFRQHLPFEADEYQIFYDSLSQQIVIFITNPTLTLSDAKDIYSDQVNQHLTAIGVDLNSQKTIWLHSN